MKSVDYANNLLYIKFLVPKSDFNYVLNVVRSLQGRNFDAINKQWIAPATQPNLDKLLDAGFVPSLAVKQIWDKAPQFIVPPTPRKEVDCSLLPNKIRDYQVRGVEFLEAVNGNGIIGDSPRLGKSLQALSYCMLHPEFTKVLIVCPSNVKIVWEREINKWFHEDSIVLAGRTAYDLTMINAKFFVVNYDIFYDWKDRIAQVGFQVMIVDELHYLGNRYMKTQDSVKVLVKRTQAFEQLSKKIPHNVLLSGTPIRSAPIQFFPALHRLAPKVFPNYWKYANYYCDPHFIRGEWQFKGLTEEHADELVAKIAPYMIRRRKEDVLTDLPDKQRIIVSFDKDDTENREQELREKIAWIKDFLDDGEKLVVFAWHREVCERIYSEFKKQAVLVYGGINPKERAARQDAFQTDNKVKLFMGQVLATNVGIDLSASDTVCFVELPQNPGDLEQAEERVFMPGSGKSRITVYYLVGRESPEERVAELLEGKNQIVTRVLDNRKADKLFE